MRHSFNS